MDRANLGNARVAGMNDDLGLSDTDFSLALNMFQISYIVFSPLSNTVLPRLRPSRYVSAIMLLWGTVVACMAAAQSARHLYALRFLLGIFEAGFSPAVLYLFSMWYTRRETARRFMVFWSASIMSGAFAGILAGAISGGLDGAHGIPGWRWLFIVEGVVTVAVALATPLVLIDYPATCPKFTPAEKRLAIERLEADGFDVGDSERSRRGLGLARSLWSALTTPAFWLFYIAFMTVDGSFTLNNFYPTLVEALGYDSVTAQYMTAPLYVVVLPVAITMSFVGDRWPQYRSYFIAGVMAWAALFAALTAGVRPFAARYALMCLLNIGLYSSVPLVLSFATTAFATVQPEVRAVALAIMVGYANAAQIATSYLWPDSDSPRYVMGFATHAAIACLSAVLYLFNNFWISRKPLKARL